MFRHTMATLMLENGADIRFIQEMLEHADLQSTQVHTGVSIRHWKQVHTACRLVNRLGLPILNAAAAVPPAPNWKPQKMFF